MAVRKKKQLSLFTDGKSKKSIKKPAKKEKKRVLTLRPKPDEVKTIDKLMEALHEKNASTALIRAAALFLQQREQIDSLTKVIQSTRSAKYRAEGIVTAFQELMQQIKEYSAEEGSRSLDDDDDYDNDDDDDNY